MISQNSKITHLANLLNFLTSQSVYASANCQLAFLGPDKSIVQSPQLCQLTKPESLTCISRVFSVSESTNLGTDASRVHASVVGAEHCRPLQQQLTRSIENLRVQYSVPCNTHEMTQFPGKSKTCAVCCAMWICGIEPDWWREMMSDERSDADARFIVPDQSGCNDKTVEFVREFIAIRSSKDRYIACVLSGIIL